MAKECAVTKLRERWESHKMARVSCLGANEEGMDFQKMRFESQSGQDHVRILWKMLRA